jgi:hypothetical protein
VRVRQVFQLATQAGLEGAELWYGEGCDVDWFLFVSYYSSSSDETGELGKYSGYECYWHICCRWL